MENQRKIERKEYTTEEMIEYWAGRKIQADEKLKYYFKKLVEELSDKKKMV